MSTDKNGYYISLNTNTYEVIETDYTLYMYDYDTANYAIVHDSQPDKLQKMYSNLKQLETDFSGITEQAKKLCNTYNLEIDIERN